MWYLLRSDTNNPDTPSKIGSVMSVLKMGRKATVIAASALPVAGAVAAKAFADYQNGSLVTTEYAVKSRHVPKSMDGFRIVQVSDLHDATFGYQNEKLVEAVRAARPDLIAITGDFIHDRTIENAMAFVRHAISIAPIVFSPGNHEPSSPRYPELREQLIGAGVVLLEDDVVTGRELGISRPSKGGLIEVPGVTVMGVADQLFSSWLDRAEPEKLMDRKMDELVPLAERREDDKTNKIGADTAKVLGKAEAKQGDRPFRILLAHRPEHFASYAREGVDLVLAGHAHGGQWRVPGLGGLYAPSQGILPKYDAGMFEEGNTCMVISRGLGNSGFPLRLNNRPEVVVVTLSSDTKASSPIDFKRRIDKSEIASKLAGIAQDSLKEIAGVNDSAVISRAVSGDFVNEDGKFATKEFVKATAKEAVIKEAPEIAQQLIAALTPLVLSALVGRSFLAPKAK